MKRHALGALTTLAASAVLLAQPVQAASPFNEYCATWPAVAMTPYDDNIQADQYKMTHERVYHNDHKTGTILLYGPVPGGWDALEAVRWRVVYKDPDGHRTGGEVYAELRFVDRAGNISVVEKLASNYPSNHESWGNGVDSMTAVFPTHALSRDDGAYSVRVYVKRSNTHVRPAVLNYEFCSTVH